MDIVINHLSFNSRHHDKCKVALKIIPLVTMSNWFSLKVVQKCHLCVIRKNSNGVCEMSQESLTLGPVYTKHQHQHCDNSAIMLVILSSLQTMELLKNGVATHFQVTPLFSMRTESLASLQSYCSTDAEAWCKLTLRACLHWVSVITLRWC